MNVYDYDCRIEKDESNLRLKKKGNGSAGCYLQTNAYPMTLGDDVLYLSLTVDKKTNPSTHTCGSHAENKHD
jgi:hypothetical protein